MGAASLYDVLKRVHIVISWQADARAGAAKEIVFADTTAALAGDAPSAAKPIAATSAPKLPGKDSDLEKKKKAEVDKIASQKGRELRNGQTV